MSYQRPMYTLFHPPHPPGSWHSLSAPWVAPKTNFLKKKLFCIAHPLVRLVIEYAIHPTQTEKMLFGRCFNMLSRRMHTNFGADLTDKNQENWDQKKMVYQKFYTHWWRFMSPPINNACKILGVPMFKLLPVKRMICFLKWNYNMKFATKLTYDEGWLKAVKIF